MAELNYPIGIQSFSEIRRNNYVYVDKTFYVHDLITRGKYVFLSRPRRFGKSLLLSTIEAFFLGQRQLFKGLYIDSQDHEWNTHPVFHLDLSGTNYSQPDSLYIHLDDYLSGWESNLGIIPEYRKALGLRFKNVIQAAHSQTGQEVVILIDEYDKPLLDTVDAPKLQEDYRNDLRAFYSNLKSQDKHIRFAMLTGVTKFGHLSIFSDLNNLKDISMYEKYAGICGITTEELHQYFEKGIEEFAAKNGLDKIGAFELLRNNYDGYHFSPQGSPDIYNPFSLLSALDSERKGEYWFGTGTPTFLVKMLKDNRLPLADFEKYESSISNITNVSFNLNKPIPVLYQSGYLTIKGYNDIDDFVILGFPNKEVESGFFNNLLELYASLRTVDSELTIRRFVDAVRNGDVETFMTGLQSLFSDFQYDAFDLRHLEQHYQDVIYIVMKLMGLYVRTEYRTASGRIDLLIKTADYIYLFEFKMDKSAAEALDQINTKDYLLPFRADGRKIVRIGANFSHKIRSISEWIIQPVQ